MKKNKKKKLISNNYKWHYIIQRKELQEELVKARRFFKDMWGEGNYYFNGYIKALEWCISNTKLLRIKYRNGKK